MANGEADVQLHSVIVQETNTGYAQCFREGANNPRMGRIDLADIVFAPPIMEQWRDPRLFDRVQRGERLAAPTNPPG